MFNFVPTDISITVSTQEMKDKLLSIGEFNNITISNL